MLSSILRQYRIQRGLRVADVAASIGIERESLSRIEAGKSPVGVKTLLALASFITVPTDEWLEPWLSEESRLHPLTVVAKHFIDRGDLDHAGRVFQRIRTLVRLDRHPRDKGEIYHQWGRWAYASGSARALHWLRLAEHAALRASDPQDKTVATYNYALALKRAHFVAQSIRKFEQVISESAHGMNPQRGGYARLLKANILFDCGSYHEALAEYRRAYSSLRGNVWAFDCKLGEAICLWNTRSPQVALRVFPTVLKLASDSERQAKYHHNISVLYRHLGMISRALERLPLALYPDRSVADTAGTLAELCLCQALTGDNLAADQTLERFCSLNGEKEPFDVAAMTILALILRADGPRESLSGRTVQDNYEGRLTAALSLLQVRMGAATSDKQG